SPASLSAPTTPTTPTAPEGTGARNARPGLDLGPLLSAPTSPPVQRVPHDLTGHRAATVVAVPDLVALPTTVPLLVARSAGRSDGAVQLGANATVSLGDTASPGPGATTAPLPGRAATDSASAASSAPLVGLSHLMRALDPTGAGITGEAESTGDAGDARAAPETRAARAPAEPPTSAGPDVKVMSAGVSPSPATRRPGLGAPIATDTMIQRSVVATSFDVGATPVRASSPHLAVPHLSTHPLLGRGMSESPTPIALDEVFAGPTPSPRDTSPRDTSPRDTSPRATSPRAAAQRDAEPTIAPQDAPELVLPHRRAPQPSATAGSTSPVAQRVADRTAYQQTAAQGAEQMADQSAVRDTGAASAPTHADPAGEPTVAPLLSDTGLTVLTAGALPPTAAAPAGEGSVATVRRIGTGVGSGTATASISQPFSTRDASAVVQRTPAVRGLGAPMVTPSAPAQHDPVTVRTMSLQRMFDPGTAAITSGVTRPHSDTSVGFEPSVPTPLIVTGHRDATAQRSADPSSAGQAIRTAEPVGSDVVSRYSSEAAGVVSRSLVDEHRTPAAVQTAMDAPSAPPPVAAPAGGVAGLPTDLDELARRLFDPLSARLKSELWMDRERAGMVTDLRR
ncbi:MAG: hypothetical protein ABJA16_06485, partial [Nakamurella sp.]